MRGLDKLGFQDPTPVQQKAIEPMLEKRDLLVQAPTGTGKTGAFGIPVIEGVDTRSRDIQTVILCPTRELALQTTTVLKQLSAYKPGVRIIALYGGEPIQKQIAALRRNPQIVVATPGRMMDHMRRRTTRMGHVSLVVLDEADRMLDMGFREDMDIILQSVPTNRQTVLFSATLSDGIKRIATEYQRNAEQITIKQDTLTVDCVQQFYAEIKGKAKTPALISLMKEKNFDLSLVFVATKAMADTLAQQLNSSGFRADALHGDLRQSHRDRVMDRYRRGQVRILVATDVAARGIDVNNIDAVINYDIPQDSDSYVHRIGRTGRAKQSGAAYTFIYPKERSKLRSIMLTTKASILPIKLEVGQMPEPLSIPTAPKPYSGNKPSYGGKPSYGNNKKPRGEWSGKPQQKRRGKPNNRNTSEPVMQVGA